MIRKTIVKLLEFNNLKQKFGLKQALEIYYQLFYSQTISVSYRGDHFMVNSEKSTIYHLLNSIDKIKKHVEFIPATKGKTILDIGANCGLFSLFVKKRFPEARIYVFEPSTSLQKVLTYNLELEGIQIIPKAISDFNGDTEFFINKSSQQTNSLVRVNVEPFAEESKIIKQKITSITLDAFVKETGIEDIDIIKLDVQGAENSVVEGGKITLSKTSCLIAEVSFVDNSVFDFIEEVRKFFPFYKVINPVLYGADIFFSKEPLE